MKSTVLLLDASQRSALAAARSLGGNGAPVVAGKENDYDIAACSRHILESVRISDPQGEPEGYAETVHSAAAAAGAELVLPMTDASTMLLLDKPSRHGDVTVMAPPPSAYETLSDKEDLLTIAASLGVSVPRSIAVADPGELGTAAREIGFPIIFKPARSKVLEGSRIRSTAVRRIDSERELDQFAASWPLPTGSRALIQETIPGAGAGIFALYGTDGAVAWFAHKRLREKPPAGGVSVLCESVALDDGMQHAAEKLLSHANWYGPAMVEFKVTPEGTPYLMEINGRFWGSLQLAIDCGVDFPWLFYQIAQGESVQGPETYPVGRRMRWLLGDFDRLLLQLRGRGTAHGLVEKLREIGRFVNFFDPDTRLEVLRRDDMGPFRAELAHWFRSLGGG